MSSHDEYAALLDAFLDGELSGAEAEGVRVHLSECADCQAYIADALAMRDAFPDIEETVVPDGFAESVLAALPPRRVSWRAHWAKIVLPLAACAALAILLHGIAGRRVSDIAPGGGASMSSYTEEAATTADADAGGAAVSDDADTVPPQAPELYGVAESQAVQNATADKTESDMTPFAMRSSGAEAPEESVSNRSAASGAAPAAAKEVPDGYAATETFPDTETVPDEAPATTALPDKDAATESVP
ncbi:MAG: zf-HC2 domain-containing protein, partial [Oscillibacter sp.]|nr:zf-HC2 domain-containing protein [Oscillibacter sp.]